MNPMVGRVFLTPETFTWCGRRFLLEVEHGPPVRYLLRCKGPGDPWNVLLLGASAIQKEITPEEYDELTSVLKS
ncbi:MAG TPA: hypothetical protein VN688_07950 [Gemmataceae bacterium]|nr:hypothetical protein [Gemmataceae bacterium]